MTAATPQSAAADLWNRVVAIEEQDGDALELDRLIFRARGLVARQPMDLVARSALGLGLLLRGHREEAMPHVEAANALKGSGSSEVRLNVASLLVHCGEIDKARHIVSTLLASPSATGNKFLFDLAVKLALASGDLRLIDEAEIASGLVDPAIQEFQETVVQQGLVENFFRYQQCVMSVLEPHCCSIETKVLFDPEEGIWTAGIDVSTGLSGDEQFDLYGVIAERLPEETLELLPYVSVGIWGPKIRPITRNAA